MGKILRNIIICICILYFVLSVVYSITFKGYYEEVMAGYDENYMLASSLEKYTLIDYSKTSVRGNLNIINNNIQIIAISVILGFMLGLLISMKENSIVKYIVFLILGYLLYCVLWTFITILINKSVSDIIPNNFIKIYENTLPKMFWSYIMFYFAGVLGAILKNKMKVKSLNETLKNPNNKEKNEKGFKIVKRVIITVIILLIVIFIGNTIRKTVILINYSNKINEISKCNNYYMKKECRYNYMEDNTFETYYKDGTLIHKDIKNNSILYCNENLNENLSYNLNENTVLKLKDNFYFDFYKIKNKYWVGTSIRKWGSLLLSFSVNIYSEEFNGKNCYVIERSGEKIYIEKDTYLQIREIQIIWTKTLSEGERINESISDYTYEFGNVTDEDVAKPDMTGFTEKEN